MNFICFDMEGPLSPQDNAYELMKFIHKGELFKVISRYDDILTLEKRKDYEPGDTLSLIVPFLLHAKMSQADMEYISNRASITDGAKEFIAELKLKGWWVGDITTSYQQYGYPITQRIGVPSENVKCTSLPNLDYFREIISEADHSMIEQVENEIIALNAYRGGDRDSKINERLDFFFNTQLSGTVVGELMKKVKPLGGRRKTKKLREFAKKYGFKLNQGLVVGDSITDSKMLEAVKKEGGIAVAFNANEYALPYANMSLASTNLGDLCPVIDAWEVGGKDAVEEVVKKLEEKGGTGNRNCFHWLSNKENLDEIIGIHKRMRLLVREEAGKLG